MDAFLNWVLPMHCNWFILWCSLSVIATILVWVWAGNNNTVTRNVNGVDEDHYRAWVLIKWPVAIFVTLIGVAVFTWLIYSANRNIEIDHEERIEIKPVKYPDGKVVQMFTCEGKNYNVNYMYSCAPAEGSYIRRVIYKTVYTQVYWPANRPQHKATNDDAFILVTPNGEDKKADKLEPAN